MPQLLEVLLGVFTSLRKKRALTGAKEKLAGKAAELWAHIDLANNEPLTTKNFRCGTRSLELFN